MFHNVVLSLTNSLFPPFSLKYASAKFLDFFALATDTVAYERITLYPALKVCYFCHFEDIRLSHSLQIFMCEIRKFLKPGVTLKVR